MVKSARVSVIHSCTSLSWSGLERYVVDLAEWQHRQNLPVEVFCREGSQIHQECTKRGIPAWTIGHDEKKGPLTWIKHAGEWKTRLKTAAASRAPIVLHMHAGGEPWFHMPWILKKPLGMMKTILQFHLWINHRKHDPLHMLVYSGVDEVWCSSESARAHLASILPVKRERMRVVPYGRDVHQLETVPVGDLRKRERERLGLKDDDIVGICVSRIEPIKGVAELFDGFLEIAARHPRAKILLVGNASPDNEEAAEYDRVLKRRHAGLSPELRERFKFLGYIANCVPQMAAADFYVLPSYEECMSLAMLDATILGLPILGTNAGGTPSIARPGETGWLVPPRDARAMSRVLDEAFHCIESRPEEFLDLSKHARELGRSFEQSSIFRKIWSAYAE